VFFFLTINQYQHQYQLQKRSAEQGYHRKNQILSCFNEQDWLCHILSFSIHIVTKAVHTLVTNMWYFWIRSNQNFETVKVLINLNLGVNDISYHKHTSLWLLDVSVDTLKCAGIEIGLHHQVLNIKSILGNIWCNKIPDAKQKGEGDGACPSWTGQAGLSVLALAGPCVSLRKLARPVFLLYLIRVGFQIVFYLFSTWES
jgi:hypothetical protein